MEKESYKVQEEVLKRIRHGDSAAFTWLYNQYYKRLYVHAYQKTGNRQVAQDLIHDLFAHIWEKREALSITSNITAYLYRATRNRVINYITHQQVNAKYFESIDRFLKEHCNSTDHLIREKELNKLINLEINKLSPQVKKVFRLSRDKHFSHKEIAKELNISENTVRDYIKAALKMLRMKFGIIFLMIISYFSKFF